MDSRSRTSSVELTRHKKQKTSVVTLRLTDNERKCLEKAAQKKTEGNMSELLRQMIWGLK